jgi:rfaE bifunctional protein kinase chain/domain
MFADCHILVVGDLILDEFIAGAARRMSPEAPVPVVEIASRSYLPGGAANVAANLAALGAGVGVIGVVGSDYHGQRLLNELEMRAIDTAGVFTDCARPTTVKTRVTAQNQQLLRMDQESRDAVHPELNRRLSAYLESRIADADAVVLSDYGKGVVSESLARYAIVVANRARKPIVVDPKAKDFRRYMGATVITPNLVESCCAARWPEDREPDVSVIARRLRRSLSGCALLITRGPAGMSLFRNGCAPVHIPACAHSVSDVTGAGDTVVAVLTLSLASGKSLEDAAWLANRAAAIVVGKLGTACVTAGELSASLNAPAPVDSEGPRLKLQRRPALEIVRRSRTLESIQ